MQSRLRLNRLVVADQFKISAQVDCGRAFHGTTTHDVKKPATHHGIVLVYVAFGAPGHDAAQADVFLDADASHRH